MSITIHTPKKLFDSHYELFIFAIALFAYGFAHGLIPEYAQPVIEKAKELQFEPYNITANIKAIFINNGLLSIVLWLGWILIFFFGLNFFPPTVMIYNIGVPFGAVASNLTPLGYIQVLLAFGVFEALGFIFSMVAGLLFPKYFILKLLRRSVSFDSIITDSFSLFIYGAAFIFLGAFFEALLLSPQAQIAGLALGTLATVIVLHKLWKSLTH
ncbi:MAG: hypothetical protein QW734_01960 [Candidatus Bathyarchaeia archaeon]